jgi:hypothetical protein
MLEGLYSGDAQFMKEKVLMLNPAGIILLVWATVELFTGWFDGGLPEIMIDHVDVGTAFIYKFAALLILILLTVNLPINHKLVEK